MKKAHFSLPLYWHTENLTCSDTALKLEPNCSPLWSTFIFLFMDFTRVCLHGSNIKIILNYFNRVPDAALQFLLCRAEGKNYCVAPPTVHKLSCHWLIVTNRRTEQPVEGPLCSKPELSARDISPLWHHTKIKIKKTRRKQCFIHIITFAALISWSVEVHSVLLSFIFLSYL